MGGRVAIGLSGCQEWPNRRLSPRAIFNSTLTKEPRLPGLAATGVPFSGSWLMRQPMKEPWEELRSLPADMGLNSRCDRVFPSGTFLSHLKLFL